MGYPPLLLSDKVSTGYLLLLLALQLLTTSVRLSFVLHLTSPARPSITNIHITHKFLAYIDSEYLETNKSILKTHYSM